MDMPTFKNKAMKLRLALLALVVAGCGFQHGSAGSPATTASAEQCRTVDAVVLIHLDPQRWADIVDHVHDATDQDGLTRHLHLDRPDADAHRAAALAGVLPWSRLPLRQRRRYDPDTGRFDAPEGSDYALAATLHDRDEYPPASSREGGEGSTVRYVPHSENSSQGAAMGAVLNGLGDAPPYCDGQMFELVTP